MLSGARSEPHLSTGACAPDDLHDNCELHRLVLHGWGTSVMGCNITGASGVLWDFACLQRYGRKLPQSLLLLSINENSTPFHTVIDQVLRS